MDSLLILKTFGNFGIWNWIFCEHPSFHMGRTSQYLQEFQVPKMKVPNLIRLSYVWVVPYLSHIHTAYIIDTSILGTNKICSVTRYPWVTKNQASCFRAADGSQLSRLANPFPCWKTPSAPGIWRGYVTNKLSIANFRRENGPTHPPSLPRKIIGISSHWRSQNHTSNCQHPRVFGSHNGTNGIFTNWFTIKFNR